MTLLRKAFQQIDNLEFDATVTGDVFVPSLELGMSRKLPK
jgi:hypothetical protein